MSFGIPVRNGLAIGLLSSTTLSSNGGLFPAMSLDFLQPYLDSRVTFTRGTTGTFVGSNGLIQTAAIDAPRFDYDPVTLQPKGILIEEQRVNLLLQSETLDNASWSKGNGTVTANAIASPDGTVNADAFIENTAASVFHFIAQTVAKAASNIQYTASFYVKDKGRQVSFSFNSGAAGVAGRVNPATGTVTTAIGVFGIGWTAGSLTISDAGNGWYRVVIVATSDTLTTATFQISLNNGTTVTYTGDGVSGAYLWGIQLEAGAFATSYIPTVASTVTRSADVATMTGTNFSSWYNQTEGTFVADGSLPTISVAFPNFYTVSTGLGSNRITQGTPSAAMTLTVVSGGVMQVSLSSGFPPSTTPFKVASSYKLNDFASCLSGGTVVTDTSGILPIGVDQIAIGTNATTTGAFANGHIRSIQYYNTRLSDAQLQALTA